MALHALALRTINSAKMVIRVWTSTNAAIHFYTTAILNLQRVKTWTADIGAIANPGSFLMGLGEQVGQLGAGASI